MSLNRVEKLNLFHTELTEAQLLSLFESMNQGTAIKQIDIESHTHLQNVPPQLFASMVNNLECTNLGFTSLSQQHFEYLFLLMKKRTNLKILNIRDENAVSSVEPALISETLNKVKTVNLTRCNLAHHHIKLFLDKIIEKTNIEELQLAENDLSAAPIKLLSECVRCLKIVNFSQAGLSKNQIIKILRDIRNSKETGFGLVFIQSNFSI